MIKQRLISLFAHLLLVSLLLLTVGCGARRHVTTDADFAEELSQSLNMELSPKDNLLLYAFVNEWIGVPYVFGGNSKRGTDCSNFVRMVMAKSYGSRLSRSSETMYKRDVRKISKAKLREGDLVFFSTGRSKRVNHVGIYLKQGLFAHASTQRGVMISSLNESYFKRYYRGGGRCK